MYERSEGTGTGFAAGVMTGAMLGIGLTLLFAPKAGSLLRKDVGESVGSLREALSRRYREVVDRASAEFDNLQERAGKAATTIETGARDVADAAGRVNADRERWNS